MIVDTKKRICLYCGRSKRRKDDGYCSDECEIAYTGAPNGNDLETRMAEARALYATNRFRVKRRGRANSKLSRRIERSPSEQKPAANLREYRSSYLRGDIAFDPIG